MYYIPETFARDLSRWALVSTLFLTAACETSSNNRAIIAAQPKAPAQRNHTNFYPALQCMDDLFVKAKRPKVLISSNQIPDKTRKVNVDTRGMIITALNHMTRRSKAFVFVEQGLVGRTSGDTLALEKDDPKGAKPPQPQLYINGAISQLDDEARDVSLNATLDGLDPGESGLSSTQFETGANQTVVSLDLHLVGFPSRVVIPGSAVSNSITVSRKRWGPGLVGVISQRTLGLTLEIETVESTGQAVRSLIELGLIETLGRYTGVPFWECLSKPEVLALETARAEREHMQRSEAPERLRMAQRVLQRLGYPYVSITGSLDEQTRAALANFQAQQGILSSGQLDFDTYRALEKAHAAMQAKPARVQRRAEAPSAPHVSADQNGYKSLQVFVDDMF